MDKSWINQPTGSPSYIKGVGEFVEYAKSGCQGGKIMCPCDKCRLGRNKIFSIDEVERHLLFKGFFKDYKDWIFHGSKGLAENLSNHSKEIRDNCENNGIHMIGKDNVGGLLNDAFPVTGPFVGDSLVGGIDDACDGLSGHDTLEEGEEFYDDIDEVHYSRSPKDETKYKKLLEASNEALYPGCSTFSKLSFILRLFHMKCMFNWSAKSFSMLFELIKEAFPQITSFPSSYYEAQKMIKDLGLGYEKIDACPNDCMLYWGDNANKSQCEICHSSRWKKKKDTGSQIVSEGEGSNLKGTPLKVLRYFPLIPRLKRMYMSSKIAGDMRWHEKDRIKDNILRHPADAKAWQEFYNRYPSFASDARSVRLGLASDGFNPYGLMSLARRRYLETKSNLSTLI